MSRPPSLRRLLLLGSIGFAIAASAVMLGTIVRFDSMQRDVDRERSLQLSEQQK